MKVCAGHYKCRVFSVPVWPLLHLTIILQLVYQAVLTCPAVSGIASSSSIDTSL